MRVLLDKSVVYGHSVTQYDNFGKDSVYYSRIELSAFYGHAHFTVEEQNEKIRPVQLSGHSVLTPKLNQNSK